MREQAGERPINWRAISAIVRKDVTLALRTKAVAMPLLIVPLLLMVGLPLLLGGIVLLTETMGLSSSDIDELQRAIPPHIQPTLAGLTAPQAGLVFALVYMFAPLFLIVPLMVSSVVAADSFAGEKERKTLEALAYTPTTDRELLLAKMLGGWIPGVLVGLVGFVLYTMVVDFVTWRVTGNIYLPNFFWLLLAFWVGPAAAGVGLGVTVLVSARVNTFQEAYQLGSLVVLPVVFLMIGQLSGLFYLNTAFVFVIGLLLWAINLILFFAGAATFRRSELMARLS
jgi:ABC-type Na+ efflux pump permease subunit